VTEDAEGYPSPMADDDALLEELRLQAKVAPRRPTGAYGKPKGFPPADPGEIAATETDLRFRLPPLLRRIYAEVADGGLGPGYGLLPVRRGRKEPGQDESLVEVRDKLAADPRWPPLLLPLCDWGCAIWSCLDCRSDDGPIVTVAAEEPFANAGHDLRSWLRAWLAGSDLWSEMFEPGATLVGVNPFTKKPVEMRGQGKPRGRPWT
jgi:hypothetical protein